MNERAYRRQWLRLKDKYERQGMRIFRGAFRKAVSAIPLDRLTAGNYQELVGLFLDTKPVFEAFKQTYLTVGKAHGQLIGEALDKEDAGEKRFVRPMFDNVLADRVQNYLLSEGGKRIVSVNQQMSEYIIQYIARRLGENASVRDLTNELQRQYNNPNFYRWQMERIVRTETTAAANYSALLAAEGSRLVLQKKWISGADARVRRRPKSDYDHLELNGKLVEKDGVFKDNGATLRFPGDPDAPAGAVINCRCTVAMVPKRDANGRLMRTGVAQQPMTMPNLVGPMERRPQGFVPAKTMDEIHQRLERSGAMKANLSSLDMNRANAVLKAFEDEFGHAEFWINKVESQTLPAKNKANAFYAYLPDYGEIVVNKKKIGTSFNDKPTNIRELIDMYERISSLGLNGGYTRAQLQQVRTALPRLKLRLTLGEEYTKNWSVSSSQNSSFDATYATTVHEIGHHRHHKLKWAEDFVNNETNPTEYSYKNSHEYFAEWYAWWRLNGPEQVPKDLLEIFKKIG